MNRYLFSRKIISGEQYIISSGRNRKEARNKIPMKCTYCCMVDNTFPSWMIDLTYL